MNDDAPEPIPPTSPDPPLPAGTDSTWDARSVGSVAILHDLAFKAAAIAIARGSNLITFTDLLAAYPTPASRKRKGRRRRQSADPADEAPNDE
jgi:hypothetical protein